MSDPQPLLDQLWQAYRTGNPTRMGELARLAIEQFPDRGDGWFAAACAFERAGDLRRADKAFARASRSPVEPAAPPYRCGFATFKRLVDDVLETLPPPLRAVIDEVTLILTDYPDADALEITDDPELLGLFTGPCKADGDQPGEISPRIHLYRRAHEHACSTADEFRDELRKTLLHEFGHYLGYDEDGLERLGLD